MKVSDLVKNTKPGAGFGALGLVMEEEEYEGEVGHWVLYFEDPEAWRWYSFDERYDTKVINETR